MNSAWDPLIDIFFNLGRDFFSKIYAFPVGLVHCSRDLQTSFFNKTFIKNGSYDIIHTFKNYFVIVFSVFSKISGIQTHSTTK